MPATFITKESFPLEVEDDRLNEEIRIRLRAGAIKCWFERGDTVGTLLTEWNVVGEQ